MILLDVWLQGSKLDGLQLLDEIKRREQWLDRHAATLAAALTAP